MNPTCQTCTRPVRRGDAVIRGNGHVQLAWHPTCFLLERWAEGLVVVEVERTSRPLTERLEAARERMSA